MSKVIDERVVEMRFNNKQFESATKETLGTLSRLKEALNFKSSTQNIKDLDKSIQDIRLDGIAAGVDALVKRFSLFGEITRKVQMSVVNSLHGIVTKGINYVTDAVVSGGQKRAQNIENARFQLQQIVKDTEKVAQIMDVASNSVDGTAYSFDVAAKAASQFTASGITDMDSLSDALKGLAGTTATFNADYESMSMIWTQVAGQGRLMGDQLLQLSTRGANAAVTIAEYMNGVSAGTIDASENVKRMVKSISGGLNVTEADIRDFTSKGKINFEIFSSAMSHAFGDSAKEANKTFNGALANIRAALARIGEGFFSPLIAENSELVRLFNAIRIRINDVKKSLVFDKSLGNVYALSKQVTDYLLGVIGALADWVEALDLTDTMDLFYHGVEIAKASLQALGSVLKPVGLAIKEVFFNFKMQSLIDGSKVILEFVRGLKLSEEASNALKDGFTGMLKPVKLVLDLFGKLVLSAFKVNTPVGKLVELLLKLAGAVGRSISDLTDWVQKSTTIQKAYTLLGAALDGVIGSFSKFINWIIRFGKEIDFLPTAQKILTNIIGCFHELGEYAAPYISDLTSRISEFAFEVSRMIPEKISSLMNDFASTIEKIRNAVKNLSFKRHSSEIKDYAENVDDLRISMSNVGNPIIDLIKLLTNLSGTKKDLIDFGPQIEKIDEFKLAITEFGNWMHSVLYSLFKDATINDLISGAAGIGIVYSFSKAAKAIANMFSACRDLIPPLKEVAKSIGEVAKSIAKIPAQFAQMLKGINGAIKAYQRDLNASALIKVAGAIAILAGAIGVLSLLDTDKVMTAAKSLSLIAATLLVGVTLLQRASNVGKTATDALYEFTVGVHKALDNFSKARKWKAFASVIQSFGTTIALITASVISLAVMYKKDEASIKSSLKILGIISVSIVGVITIMTALGQFMSTGMKSFSKAATGLSVLSLSLGIAVFALNKLFKMTIPSDADIKLEILGGIFGALGLLSLILAEAASTANGAKFSTSPILALTAMLVVTVGALDKLFKINLPSDWKAKSLIMAGIFAALSGVVIAIGYASKLAGGALKAAGTILSLTVFIGAVVAALIVLTIIPLDKILKGTLSLGVILLALGAALYGAGQVSDPSASKAVLSMAIAVGSIVAALTILGIIDGAKLLKATVALGGVLLALAGDLYAASKITTKMSIAGIVAMIAEVGVIAYALYNLSNQPWEGMLAAGASISAVLLSLGSLSKTISSITFNPSSIAALLEGIVGLIAVAGVIYLLSNQPWEGMLAAGASISMVLLSMSAAMAVCSVAGAAAPAALVGIGLLDLFIANFGLLLYALGHLTDNAKAIMSNGMNILSDIGFAIGDFVGQIVKGFTEAVVSTLPAIGSALSGFAENLSGFIQSIREIDDGVVNGVKNLALMVLTITGVEFLKGITKWVTGGNTLLQFGLELVQFGPLIKLFAWEVKGIDASSVQGAASAASIMAELADKLPPSGGLKQKIFGETTLSEFGAELVKFGPSLKVFALTVKGITEESVRGAAAAGLMLTELARSIPASGGLKSLFTGDNSLDGFGQKLMTFGFCLKSFDESVSGINVTHLLGVINAFQKIVDVSAMIDAVNTSNITKFSTALTAMAHAGLNEFMAAFDDGTTKVKKKIDNLISEVVKLIRSKTRDVSSAASEVANAFADRIKQILTDEGVKIQNKAILIGQNIVRGVANGLNANISLASNAAVELARSVDKGICRTLEIHSPSQVAILRARQFGQGIQIGIQESIPLAQEAAANLASGVVGEIQKGFDVLKTYSVYGTDVLKPLEDKLKKTKKLTRKTASAITDFENQTSAAKKAGTAQAKKDNEDKYALEDDYWSKLLAIKREGHEKEKYLETTIQDFRKEVLEEATKAYEEYMNQLQSTRESVMNQMSIFDEVEAKEVIDKEELIYIMEDQIMAHEEYLEILKSLDRRLEGSPLYEYLAKMGVESLDQLREISRMTDRELSTYAMLYEEKMMLATDTAIYQLSDMEAQTNAKLAEIFGGMTDAVNLFDFGTYFDGSIESVTAYVEEIMIPLQNGMELMKGVPAMYSGTIVDSLGNMTSSIALATKNSVEKATGEIGPGFQTAGESAGKFMGEGISTGLIASEESLTVTAQQLIEKLNTTLKNAGQIHSPSQLTHQQIGIPLGQGIANGLVDPIVLTTLNAAATLIVSKLFEFFGQQRERIAQIGQAITSTLSMEIQNNSNKMKTVGTGGIDAFIEGIKARFSNVRTTIGSMNLLMLMEIMGKFSAFRTHGTKVIDFFISGMSSKYELAVNSVKSLLSRMTNSMNNSRMSFYSCGKNLGQGFVDGVRSMISAAERAGSAIGNAALNAAKEALDEHSPSKEMETVGINGGVGFVVGLLKQVTKAAIAGKEIGDTAKSAVEESFTGLSDVVSFGQFDDPVITPVVDLSEVNRATLDIQRMFNEAIEVSGASAIGISDMVERRNRPSEPSSETKRDLGSEGVTKFEFIQNNYSPKALSREDIYRRTNNQFSNLKRLVDKYQ